MAFRIADLPEGMGCVKGRMVRCRLRCFEPMPINALPGVIPLREEFVEGGRSRIQAGGPEGKKFESVRAAAEAHPCLTDRFIPAALQEDVQIPDWVFRAAGFDRYAGMLDRAQFAKALVSENVLRAFADTGLRGGLIRRADDEGDESPSRPLPSAQSILEAGIYRCGVLSAVTRPINLVRSLIKAAGDRSIDADPLDKATAFFMAYFLACMESCRNFVPGDVVNWDALEKLGRGELHIGFDPFSNHLPELLVDLENVINIQGFAMSVAQQQGISSRREDYVRRISALRQSPKVRQTSLGQEIDLLIVARLAKESRGEELGDHEREVAALISGYYAS